MLGLLIPNIFEIRVAKFPILTLENYYLAGCKAIWMFLVQKYC